MPRPKAARRITAARQERINRVAEVRGELGTRRRCRSRYTPLSAASMEPLAPLKLRALRRARSENGGGWG